MTAIIGLVEKGVVYLGGDSVMMFGPECQTMPGRKVFTRGELLLAASGTVLYQNHVQYLVPYINPHGYLLDEAYIVAFAASLKAYLKDLAIEGCNMLIGFRGGIYQIGTDCSVAQNTDGLYTIGSGCEYASGAMLALKDLPPERRILKALKIVAHFASGVGPPFYVEKQEAKP